MKLRLVFVVAVLAAALSCVGPGIQAQVEVVRSDIEKARKSGAYKCAPKELALAESHADFAENELAQGDALRARQHIDVAVQNANAALASSHECAPKRVIIQAPPPDKDNDGVLDAADACPDDAEDKDGDRDDDGRPDLDVDGDGIEDCVASCPLPVAAGQTSPPVCDACAVGPAEQAQEDKDGFEDLDGCPERDNDKDGLLDGVDACPIEPGPPESKGCPRKDSDGDGFFDDEDACPDKPGVSWPDNPKKTGCPPVLKLIEVTDSEIKIKQQVQFDVNKATIKPVSAKLLAEVGLVIRQSPTIKKVVIEGHTDDVGDDQHNQDLSQERANSVRQWLIDKEHVSPDALEAIGYGETRPIASNRTKAGRQTNRRSEFKVERVVKQVVVPDEAAPHTPPAPTP